MCNKIWNRFEKKKTSKSRKVQLTFENVEKKIKSYE